MAVPAPHVLAAGGGVNGLILLLIAVAAFAVVIVVAAVVLALIQAVLPGGDTEADKLHAAELERQGNEAGGDLPAKDAGAAEEATVGHTQPTA
jgi:hypothetical protein